MIPCRNYLAKIVHIATGLTPPRSTTHMLGSWLTGIVRVETNLIFVGATAIIRKVGVLLVMALFLNENQILLLCRLYSGAHIGYIFWCCSSVRA